MKTLSKKSGGKKPLYNTALKSSNHRKALGGRFVDHPAYIAIRNLAGVADQLGRHKDAKSLKRMRQMMGVMEGVAVTSLASLKECAQGLKGQGDKLRFAEAVMSFLAPSKTPDLYAHHVCWEEIEFRTENHCKPSKAELRKIVKEKHLVTFTDLQWRRLLERVGLNTLPTAREKKGALCVGIR
jgi:hypothetical protein